MVPHRSRSNRKLPIVALALVLAATLLSCGRGGDTPPPSNEATADTAAPAPAPPPPPPPRELTWSGKVDMALWSPTRVKLYKVALQRETPSTLAILSIPRLKLEVPVYDGTTDAVSTSRPAGSVHGPARDAGQRRHRGPPGWFFPSAEGHQGRRHAGAGYARRDRAVPR